MKAAIEIIKTILTAALISGVILAFVQPTIVSGHSMDPTLGNGDYLLASRLAYTGDRIPSHGDIVTIKGHYEEGKLLIKRVIATEGDHLEIRGGSVFLNGKLLDEPYVTSQGGTTAADNIDVTLGKDEIFCMGDNRPASLDSRDPSVGIIKEEDITGKVFMSLFPLGGIH